MVALRFRFALVLFGLMLVTGTRAEDLGRAREALQRGRPDLAFQFCQGESLEARVTRLQVFCELGEYTEARALLASLETEQHGAFPPPYDFRFYLFRGAVEKAAHNFALADKNYNEALRRARSAEQKVKVWIRRSEIWIDLDDTARAAKIFSQTRALGSDVLSRESQAALLELNARLQYDRGEPAGAAACSRAARELYKSLGQTSRAAWALYQGLVYRDTVGDKSELLKSTETALNEFLEVRDFPSALRILNSFQFLYFSLANSPEGERIEPLFQSAMERIPPGAMRERAQLARGHFQLDTSRETELTKQLFSDLLQSPDREIRCLAYQGLALYHSGKGEREKALDSFSQALKLSAPQMRADPQWRVSPGAILLRMSYQEKARRNYKEASRLAHRGIALQPGRDWSYWRVESRYDTLMAAMESYQIDEAKVELAAGLEEIDGLPRVSQRVGALTTILSSLLLNQSVEADVLDPATLLLADYPQATRELLAEAFEKAGGTDKYLVQFDQWDRQLRQKEEASTQAFPLIYKGLFLEALGRYREAMSALESALEIAERRQVKQARMLARVLMARVLFAQGKSSEAVDQMTEAARISETLNPLVARFYSLVAGAAQREQGRLNEALLSFDRAIEILPDKSWPGLYGRALTLEQMGRTEEALRSAARALELISSTERTHSVAQLQALKARLSARLGEVKEALSLYAQAHKGLHYSASLAEVATDYGKLLVSEDRAEEALTLYTRTLDSISALNLKLTAQQQALFETTVTLALELGHHDTALKYLQLSHSVELLDSVDLSDVQAEDEQTRTLLKELGALRLRLAGLREESGQAEDSSTRESIGQQLADTRGEFLSKLNQLKSREPDFEALVQVSGSELAAIQELLPPKTAMLEYFPAQSTLYVFLVTSDSFSLHQVSLSRHELTEMTQGLVELCTSPRGAKGEIERLSRSLHDALIGVVGEELAGCRSLRVIPSGPLWEVPFPVLKAPDGKLLAEQYEVSYLGSSELLKILSRRQFSGVRPALLVQGAGDLKGARSEVERLADLLGEAVVLGPAQLNSVNFREAVKGCRLLHLASHSVVSREAGETYIQLGDDRLNLEDVYGLELEPSSLVVLSSCESAVGVAVPGKEVTSLATAFSVAGASTVVASRWPVEDRATSLFFQSFYRELLAGKSRGEALRAAQLRMAQERQHPYYWAAFSLLGDPG